MSSLFKHLRVHQVFGANTDVGKTILTSALVRASALKNNTVFYLKPVSTGLARDADDQHVKRFAGKRSDLVHTECLFRYEEPVSPHLAAKLSLQNGSSITTPSDETLVNSIASYIRKCASQGVETAHMYLETAGGVHSPTLSGTSQVDSYRPLFLPTILIGDSKLGGISSTISSYESLLLRGFIIDAILLFRDEYYRNWEYLKSYFATRGVYVGSFKPPPQRSLNATEDFTSTDRYYETIVSDISGPSVFDVLHHLDECHASRLRELSSMPRRTLDTIWWPFVQHGQVCNDKDVTVIDSAWSDFFSVYEPHLNSAGTKSSESRHHSFLQPQFDGSASWWTQAFGHAFPALTLAAARAAGRYGHVMFPQATHLPALKLAEGLVRDGPGKGWASRAFFSDDGSTAMEVALKMALRAFCSREKTSLTPLVKKELGIIGLKGSYHGDTIGAMDACEEGVYTCEWHSAKGYWFEPPTISIQNGKVVVNVPSGILSGTSPSDVPIDAPSLAWVYDVPARLRTSLANQYRDYIERTLGKLEEDRGRKFAALVLEPLVMGAGGMIFVDPLFQRVMVDVVRGRGNRSTTQWSGLPVIFDEVFVGLYRIGVQSSSAVLGVNPDISVNAKILTGGLVPLAVTMASDSIFQAFNSESKMDALLHGHSYTAHPVGCEVANESLKILESLTVSADWNDARRQWVKSKFSEESSHMWSFWDPTFVEALSQLDVVAEVMTLGTVLSMKVRDDAGGYGSKSAQILMQSIRSNVDRTLVSSAPGGSPFGIHFRTLGDVAYFMTSLNSSSSTIRSIEERILNALHPTHVQ